MTNKGGLLRGGSGPGGVSAPRGGSGPGGYIPACTEADPPPVDRHTPVKILPWPNFVAAGKNGCNCTSYREITISSQE